MELAGAIITQVLQRLARPSKTKRDGIVLENWLEESSGKELMAGTSRRGERGETVAEVEFIGR